MPSLLRMYCQGGMTAGPLLFVLTVLPISDVSFNGRRMSYAEFWSSGGGPSAAILTLMVTVGCWGLAARALNSRWLLVLCPLVPYIPLIILSPSTLYSSMPVVLLGQGAAAAFTYFCLFRLRSVRHYLDLGAPGGPLSSV
jgi:hypothetical protein